MQSADAVDFAEHQRFILELVTRNLGLPKSVIEEELVNGTLKDRSAICYVDQQEVTEILNWHRQPLGSFLRVQCRNDIPADAEVVNTFFAPERRAIGIVLQHASFPISSPGEELPVIGIGHFEAFEKVKDSEAGVVVRNEFQSVRDVVKIDATKPYVPDGPHNYDHWGEKLTVEEEPPQESSSDFFRRVMGR